MVRASDILVVDDDPKIGKLLEKILIDEGYQVRTANNPIEALSLVKEAAPDLMITDLVMPGMNGIELIRKTRRQLRNLRAIVLTGYGTIETAVHAIKSGASDFIEKPFRVPALKKTVKRILQSDTVESDIEGEDEIEGGNFRMVGNSPQMQAIARLIRTVATSPATTVLIQGESGTGKELVARAIHHYSNRRKANFMEVNCAALTETLLEAELFGYEKGAFTGASPKGKKGLFEAATGGTVFLDEVGEMGSSLQAKLLRVLQEKRFKRVGGVDDIQVDVRIVASTNRDLQKLVEEGAFRLDLFYRLNVIPIQLPPIRQRREDIPLLAEHFIRIFAREFDSEVTGFEPKAQRMLLDYHWPGNVRELKNVIERAVIMSSDPLVGPEAMILGPPRPPVSIRKLELDIDSPSIAQMEKQLICKVLEQTSWCRSKAARLLGITRTTLYTKLRNYNIQQSAAVPCGKG